MKFVTRAAVLLLTLVLLLAVAQGHGFIRHDRKDLANRLGNWHDPAHMKETAPDALGAKHPHYNTTDCVRDEVADVAALMKAGGGVYTYMDPSHPQICMSTTGNVCGDDNGGSNPAAWYNYAKAHYYDLNNTDAYGPGIRGAELGSVLNLTISLILNHGGFHYFSLCTEGDTGCLKDPKNRLKVADSGDHYENTQGNFLVNPGGKWIEDENRSSTVGLQLPSHHECALSKRCVVVWQWLGADNGAEFGWFSCLDLELQDERLLETDFQI